MKGTAARLLAHSVAFVSAALWCAILYAVVEFVVPDAASWKQSAFRIATWIAVAVGVLTWILAYTQTRAALETKPPIRRPREKA